MENVIISGRVFDDPEPCTDRNGRTYTRFTVTCGATGANGRTRYTHYRCACYLKGYENLKRREQVFITGSLAVTVTQDDNGRTYVNLDVVVFQITRGREAKLQP